MAKRPLRNSSSPTLPLSLPLFLFFSLRDRVTVKETVPLNAAEDWKLLKTALTKESPLVFIEIWVGDCFLSLSDSSHLIGCASCCSFTPLLQHYDGGFEIAAATSKRVFVMNSLTTPAFERGFRDVFSEVLQHPKIPKVRQKAPFTPFPRSYPIFFSFVDFQRKTVSACPLLPRALQYLHCERLFHRDRIGRFK